MANESETIGQRLRARRVQLGRTLAEVAEQSGLSLPYVSNLERGRGNPTLEVLGSLAKALDVPLASLVGDSNPIEPLQVLLASAPPSLLQFSRSSDFQETVQELAERQGESVEAMRQRVLVGMVSSPQRSSGKPTEDDWRRILDAYSLILKKR
jgi:transcriptional regulator with XRE-family HTH domain